MDKTCQRTIFANAANAMKGSAPVPYAYREPGSVETGGGDGSLPPCERPAKPASGQAKPG